MNKREKTSAKRSPQVACGHTRNVHCRPYKAWTLRTRRSTAQRHCINHNNLN